MRLVDPGDGLQAVGDLAQLVLAEPTCEVFSDAPQVSLDRDPEGVLSDGEHDRPDDYPDSGTETAGHAEITGFVAVFRCFHVAVCHFFFCSLNAFW